MQFYFPRRWLEDDDEVFDEIAENFELDDSSIDEQNQTINAKTDHMEEFEESLEDWEFASFDNMDDYETDSDDENKYIIEKMRSRYRAALTDPQHIAAYRYIFIFVIDVLWNVLKNNAHLICIKGRVAPVGELLKTTSMVPKLPQTTVKFLIFFLLTGEKWQLLSFSHFLRKSIASSGLYSVRILMFKT